MCEALARAKAQTGLRIDGVIDVVGGGDVVEGGEEAFDELAVAEAAEEEMSDRGHA